VKVDPYDAGLFSSRSLCWLHAGDGKRALQDAARCKMLRPKWAKGYYRHGQALMLLKVRQKTHGLALVARNGFDTWVPFGSHICNVMGNG
jgi:hypothetical protein